MKKFGLFIMMAVSAVLLFAMSFAVSAADTLYIDGVNATAETEKISCQKCSDGQIYLFVPSTADKNALRVYFGDAEEIYVNGTSVTAGEETSVFAQGGIFTASNGSEKITVNVIFTQQAAVIVTTESGSMNSIHADKSHKEAGNVIIADSSKTQYSGKLSYIKGRGNATWTLPKRPYNIKLDKKTNLFSMGKSKSWCLLANYNDLTYVKNVIAYNLADEAGLDFSSKQVPVCLFTNGEFMGLYSLCEKVEIGENRIEITDLAALNEEANGENNIEAMSRGGDYNSNSANTAKWINIPANPEDITGGYLLEIDLAGRYNDELCGFVTKRGIPVVIKEPEYASEAEVKYIRDYFQSFEDAVYSATGINEEGKHYGDYCDFDSLVKAYIVNDFCVNLDTGITSCYFYKDSGSFLKAGPVWDYDFSLCADLVRNGYDLTNPETTFVRDGVMFDNTKCDTYYNALYDHADFEQAVLENWNTTFKPAISSVRAMVENQKTQIATDAECDYIRWGRASAASASAVFEAQTSRMYSFMDSRENFLNSYYQADHTAQPVDGTGQSSVIDEIDEKTKSFWDKIKDFFKKIGEFFRKLFK